MPLGPYRNFAECVRQNQDKHNPEAFCGKIKHAIEGRPKKRRRGPVKRRGSVRTKR